MNETGSRLQADIVQYRASCRIWPTMVIFPFTKIPWCLTIALKRCQLDLQFCQCWGSDLRKWSPPWAQKTFVVAKHLPRRCREEGSIFRYRKIIMENVCKEMASARRSIAEITIITVDVHLVAMVICMSVWVLRRIWKTDLDDGLDVLNDFRVRKGSVLLQRSHFGRSPLAVGKPGTGEPVERRVMTNDQWRTLKRSNRLDFDLKKVLIDTLWSKILGIASIWRVITKWLDGTLTGQSGSRVSPHGDGDSQGKLSDRNISAL